MKSVSNQFVFAVIAGYLSTCTAASAKPPEQPPAKDFDPKVVKAWKQFAFVRVGWFGETKTGSGEFTEARPKVLPACRDSAGLSSSAA